MKRLLITLAVGAILAPSLPAAAVNWLREGQTGQAVRAISAGSRASYTFTATGQSPTLRLNESCSTAQFQLVATSATVQPYICSKESSASGFAYATDCGRLQATNLETGIFGEVDVTEADPWVIDIPYRLVLVDVTAGTGTLWIECRP